MVAACTPEQRQELYSVICVNLREALRRWEKNLPNYTDADLAQLFDEYFKLGYDGPMPGTKAALFHFVQDASDELEWARRLTGLVRTIARRPNQIAASIARREGRTGPIAPEVSSHELAEADTYLDPHAMPDTLAAQADLQELAKKWAEGFFVTLSRTHKAALWSIAEDRSVTDPELRKLAGRGKSTVANARNDLADLLRLKLCQFCAAEAPEVMDALALEVAKAMLPLAKEWGRLENLKDEPS
jgi:hypothetical protein